MDEEGGRILFRSSNQKEVEQGKISERKWGLHGGGSVHSYFSEVRIDRKEQAGRFDNHGTRAISNRGAIKDSSLVELVYGDIKERGSVDSVGLDVRSFIMVQVQLASKGLFG